MSTIQTRTLLSVLVPLYNEEDFIGIILERVLNAPLPKNVDTEIVIVDDGSTDGSVEIVEGFVARHPGHIRLIRHERNRGKGAAIRTAIQEARGEFAIIQDADLEYDPREYPKMITPLVEERADAVFGSRFLTAGERRVLYFWHALANHFLTTLSNMVSDLNLTDMETCYKAFRLSLVRSIPLRSERFGIEPELTIKLAQREARIYEVPISYQGRTYEEGKKIGLKDAFQALGVILRYGLQRDIYAESGGHILDSLSKTPRLNRWMADTIRPFVGTRVLEIGAGIGNLTKQLSVHRKAYVATDVDDEHMSRLRTRFAGRPTVEVRRCNLTEASDFVPFTGRMDTVVCLNVLEHVKDDHAGLRNIHAALEKGGRAIILVPQGQEIYGTLDEVLGHVRRYSEKELREKMEAAGFRVEQMLRFNRVTRPGWIVNGRILKRRTFGRLQLRFFDSAVWLWRRMDHWLPFKPVSIIGVGVKE